MWRALHMLSAEASYEFPNAIRADMQAFVKGVAAQDDVVPRQFGGAMTKDVVIDRLRQAYRL